jgi:hypothetical protein
VQENPASLRQDAGGRVSAELRRTQPFRHLRRQLCAHLPGGRVRDRAPFTGNTWAFVASQAVLRIREILVRICIRRFIPL